MLVALRTSPECAALLQYLGFFYLSVKKKIYYLKKKQKETFGCLFFFSLRFVVFDFHHSLSTSTFSDGAAVWHTAAPKLFFLGGLFFEFFFFFFHLQMRK